MTKTRTEYTEKMKRQLDALNANMDALETRASEAKADARDKYKTEMAKLRHQSKLAHTKLDEIAAAGEAGWVNMVAEMDKVRDAFVHSFNSFKSRV
ncbi:MAG: hypothetical protein LT082_09140 [Comamonas sp.]|jgi:hypothetical protein|nr:hypothetical protein [Comamonas sp.]